MAISVSQAFKDAMQAPVKVIQATIVTDEQTFTSADYLTNLSIEASGYYFGATTKALEFSLLGTTYNLLNKAINVSISVQTDASNDTWEHCNLGNFYIYEQEVKLEKETTTFKAYDKVGMMAKEYYTGGDFTFPCTVANLAEQFQSKFGLSFTPETLVNGNYQITEDLYAKINNITYRDILAELAGATASIAAIDGVANTLTFRETPRTAIETWTYDNLKSIKLEPKYGAINAVTLSRAPEEDNISVIDEPVIQDEGTELEFEDVSRFKDVTLKGETAQTAYTGKNLFLAPVTPKDVWQASYTKNSDNSFTVTRNEGVSTGVAYVEIAINGLSPNTQYTISFKPSSTPIRFRTRTDGTWHSMITSDGSGVTFTSGNNTTHVAFYNFQNGDGYLISPMTVSDVQIELGSTATAYEPYVGGIGSPNPNYPQDIETVTGRQIIAIHGKNLFSQLGESSTSGLTIVGSNNNYAIEGTCTSEGSRLWVGSAKLPAGTYTIKHEYVSGEYNGNSLSFWLYFGNTWDRPFTDNLAVDQNTQIKTKTFTLSEEKLVKLACYTRNGSTFNNYTSRVSIESGSTATDFEPYSHQDLEVNLGKNLLDNTKPDATAANLTWTPTDTGGKFTRSSGTWGDGVQWRFNAEVGVTYTFSANSPSDGAVYADVRSYTDNTYSTIKTNFRVDARGNISVTFVADTPYIRVRFANNTANVSNVEIINIQFERGAASTYAPYVPFYGKNLFDKNNANIANVWASAESVISGDSLRTLYISCEPNTTYTVQKENTGANNRFMVFTTSAIPAANVPILNYVGTSGALDNSSYYTITTPATAKYLCVFFANTSVTTPSVKDILDTIQIEKGSVATSYEPCIAGPIKLSKATKSGSTFRDKIFRNSDKWYVHKEFSNITFRETDIALSSQSYTNVVYARIEKTKDTSSYGNYSDDYPLVCTHAIHGRVSSPSGWNTSGNIGRISNNASTSQWWIGFPIGTTQETARSLLTGAELYYTLKTATDVEITNPDLIAQLNAVLEAELPSETNFVTSSGDLTAYLDIEAYKKVDVKEIKLANNEILDDDRESTIMPILNSVSGFEFYPFEATTEGHGWHECGDQIAVTDGTNTWDVVINYIKLTIDGGIKETIKGIRPTETQTNYALAGGIMKTIYNTEIKVDKQGQEITSIVSRQDSFEDQTLENFSQVVQNINSVTTTIQTTGGDNLLHNSVGYNINTDKTLVSWTQSDSISSESSPESLSYGAISGSQINLGASSSITQRITVDNSGNQLYTLGFKVKKGATGVVTVHLRNNIDDYTVVIPEGSAILWKNYSIVGVLPHSSYFDVVVETNNAVSSLSITDMMFSVGDTTIPWVSASDEILSKNVAVDSSGVTVRSNATNDYTQLNELGLNGYSDASGSMENVFTVNRDTTEVSKLKARKQISMPPIKIVPVTSGSRAGWGFVKGE